MLPGDTINTIHNLITNQAILTPQAEAFLDIERGPLTYVQLYQHLQTTQQALNTMGLGRGDRVAIVLPNGPEMTQKPGKQRIEEVWTDMRPLSLRKKMDANKGK